LLLFAARGEVDRRLKLSVAVPSRIVDRPLTQIVVRSDNELASTVLAVCTGDNPANDITQETFTKMRAADVPAELPPLASVRPRTPLKFSTPLFAEAFGTIRRGR
jgi:hypothetical protein